MSNTVAFDTLKFANRLKLVGVSEKQAEAEAEIFSEIFEVNLRELAMKEDLKHLEERMDSKIDAKLSKLDAKIEQLMLRITIRLGGIVTTVAGIGVAALKLL